MKFIKTVGNLVDVLGKNARTTWEVTLGVRAVKQLDEPDGLITYFEILDENLMKSQLEVDEVKIFEMKDLQAINNEIESANIDLYSVTSEAIMNANLIQLTSTGQLDFNQLSPDASEQEELKFFYEIGCSGIVKRRKYNLFKV